LEITITMHSRIGPRLHLNITTRVRLFVSSILAPESPNPAIGFPGALSGAILTFRQELPEEEKLSTNSWNWPAICDRLNGSLYVRVRASPG